MQTASHVHVVPTATHNSQAKARQPASSAPTLNAPEAPILETQPEEGARLNHSFGAISVFPPDPPIQPKRATGLGHRLPAFNFHVQHKVDPTPVLPAGWAVRPPIQAKLTVGSPNDEYEQEADHVADQVMRMSEPRIQAKCACGGEAGTDGECAACQAKRLAVQRRIQPAPLEEEEVVQAKPDHAAPDATPDLESRLNGSRGSGQSLPEATRSSMESAFGVDFGGVRVHTGNEAVQMNKELGAQAFTHGSDIYFNAGKYEPGSQEGKGLLAHELTHVVQQRGSGVNNNNRSPKVQEKVGDNIQRSLLFESTVNICRNVLESRNFTVSNGGIRVVLLLDPLPLDIKNCNNHTFWVELSKKNEWLWIDDDITTCESETGGARSFSIGGLSKGTYYLTISRAFDNPYCCLSGEILVFDEPVAGDSSSCKRDKNPSVMDIVHGALDVAGFIPVLGAIPDGINAVIYVAEGDWVNAGISAGAMIPVIGDGAKAAVMGGKVVVKVSGKTAIKLGEEGLAKALKEAAEKTAKEAAEKAAKEAAEKAAKEAAEKAAKEAAEKAAKEAAEKAAKEAAEKAAKEAAEKAAKEAAEKAAKEAAEKAAKEAAEKVLQKRIKKCLEIYAAKEALGVCNGCKRTDTLAERASKILCLTAEIALREKYLKEDCDDVLQGSIDRKKKGQDPKKGHETQLTEKIQSLAKCATLPTK